MQMSIPRCKTQKENSPKSFNSKVKRKGKRPPHTQVHDQLNAIECNWMQLNECKECNRWSNSVDTTELARCQRESVHWSRNSSNLALIVDRTVARGPELAAYWSTLNQLLQSSQSWVDDIRFPSMKLVFPW